jgi:branched-chain amino acid transport system ATP-binding protein
MKTEKKNEHQSAFYPDLAEFVLASAMKRMDLFVFDMIKAGTDGTFKGERKERAMSLLEMVDLPDVANKYPSQISGGQQQRVALARALVLNPDVLLLDEPTAGMSAQETHQTIELTGRITREKGLTLLFTEHDMEVVFSISERIMVLHQGRLIAAGSPEEVRNNSDVKKVYLGEAR